MNDQWWWPQLAFLLFFAGMWVGVTYLLSYINGWAFLARHYRAENSFVGRYERVRASRMGPLGLFGSVRNAMYVGVDAGGLHLKMFVLFRVNCRDLFIPWSEISVSRGREWFMDFVEFHFRRMPNIPLRVYGKAGDRVKALAGAAWPAEPPHDVVQR